MIYIYNFLLSIGLVAALPYVFFRLITKKDTLAFNMEKLGNYRFQRPPEGGIWFHAVSVGEVNTIIPLALEMKKRHSKTPIILSVGTSTGMKVALSKLKGKTTLLFFPYDFPFSVKRALSYIRPALVVLTESEIWPNFIYHAKKSGVRTVLVNGRVSDRSYGRYKTVKFLFAPFVRMIDRFLMQSDLDMERMLSLGARKESVAITGNLKFDRAVPASTSKEEILMEFNIPADRLVLIFASTHRGEDEIFMEVSKKLFARYKDIMIIIAPRHVSRVEEVKKTCLRNSCEFTLRSEKKRQPGNLMILDTLGELSTLYGAAEVAVIGGSFIPHGGQNPLEALSWKVPVIFGPHMENFKEISQKLIEAGGARRSVNADDLFETITHWLNDSPKRKNAGQAGYDVILKNRGALKKTAEELQRHIGN